MNETGLINVVFDEWQKWTPEGWVQGPPDPKVHQWLKISIYSRRRPFIIIDSAHGGSRQPLRIVNSRIGKTPHGKRMFCVYVYEEGRALKCGWGEILIVDGGARLPDAYDYTAFGRIGQTWSMFKDWIRKRRGK